MKFYIKERADKSAALVTHTGQQLFTFKSVDSALAACSDWYDINAHHVIPYIRANNSM